jgi:hypothetical protein
MASEDFMHKGRQFSISSFPIGATGQFGCAIYPVGKFKGLALFEPDAVYKYGKLVHFDSEAEAIKAGKDYIRQDLLYD